MIDSIAPTASTADLSDSPGTVSPNEPPTQHNESSCEYQPLDPLHHLTWDHRKNRWRVRLVIDRGRRLVGKRVCSSFHCCPPEQAIIIRDGLIQSLEQLGFTVRNRKQRRPAARETQGGES